MNDWITLYGEMEDDDDLIPLQNIAKSVLRPGIYFSRLPLLPKWDMHFEWTSPPRVRAARIFKVTVI